MKLKLSDALRKAANECLAANDDDHSPFRGRFRESCCAALGAVRPGWYEHRGFDEFLSVEPLPFLTALGCDPHTTYFMDAYPEYEDDAERQGVRYMFLLLAACVAEDEGITV
jgi:hypothetical protein